MKNSNVVLVKKTTTTTAEGTPLVDKNGREYKRVEVSTLPFAFVDFGDGNPVKVRQEPKTTVLNVWKERYADDKEQFGFDFKEGEMIMGDIVQREVVPYNIKTKEGDFREVNQYSMVVFGNTSDKNWENKIKAAFKAADHPIAEPVFAAPVAVTEEIDEAY